VRVQHYKGGLESAELIVELMRGAQARHDRAAGRDRDSRLDRRNVRWPARRSRRRSSDRLIGGHLQVGFIGLGAMGALIVPRLMAAGHSVTGWNRSRDKARR
jgi:phosphoglycerate dehydrogenase-like enzyme